MSGIENRRARIPAVRRDGRPGRASPPTRSGSGDRATAPTAPAASARRFPRLASGLSPQCAAARCRRRRTAGCGRSARAARPGRTRRNRRSEIAAARRAARAPRARSARPPRDPTGPELTMIRRRSEAPASLVSSSVNAGSGQRRNGLPALTCATINSCAGADPRRREPSLDRRHGRGILAASPPRPRPAAVRPARPAVDRLQQIPLVDDRVPRPQLARRDRPSSSTSTRALARRSRSAAARRSPSVSQLLRGPPCRSMTTS